MPTNFLRPLIPLFVMLLLGFARVAIAETPTTELQMQVYKSAGCGCCTSWVNYLEGRGFLIESKEIIDLDPIKKQYGITPELQSCHTAVIEGYAIEGHVPVDDIKRLLKERPEGVVGLTAPGMPTYSPGMASEQPRGYAVMAFDKHGNTKVFSDYRDN